MKRNKIEILRNIIKSLGFQIEGNLDDLYHTAIDFIDFRKDLKTARELGDLRTIMIVNDPERKPFYVLKD